MKAAVRNKLGVTTTEEQNSKRLQSAFLGTNDHVLN